MNWVQKTALTLSIFLLISVISLAQGELRKAKKYIELQDFDRAITVLKEFTLANPDNQEGHISLAEAYQHSSLLTDSHTSYSKALALGEIPAAASGQYGKVLMALKDYEGALQQFSLYGTEYASASEIMIQKCVYAIEHSDDVPAFNIYEEYINTSRRDFNPSFFGDEVVYLSNRTDLKNAKKNVFNSHVNIELLRASKDSKGMLKFPKRLKSLTGQEFNIISIAYNPILEMVAVTKGGQYDNINLTSEDKCTLYIGKFDRSGSIANLKPYEFNKTDFSTGFASFSEDGMTMYFASDRSGGEGGFDIYQSKIVGGQWSAPINLGPEVNTIGNEITPSAVADILLFASDTKAGFGGFDMFKVYEGPAGFVNAENLGPGINTSFDEYGMIYDARDNVGYLTSTRSQGKGMEDIYRIQSLERMIEENNLTVASEKPTVVPRKTFEILKGMALNQNSGDPIGDVEVLASTDEETTIISAKTNDKGMFSIPLEAGKYYTLKFKSDLYLSSSRTIMMDAARRMPLMKVDMIANQAVDVSSDILIQPVALGSSAKVNKVKPSLAVSAKDQVHTKTKEMDASPVIKLENDSRTPVEAERTSAVITNSKVMSSEPTSSSTFSAPTTSVAYAVQVAAISKNEKATRFANIKDLGSLYTLFDSRVYKVRCGLFGSRQEAMEVLKRIKIRGYDSAFIVEEKPSDSMDLVMMDFGTYERTNQESIISNNPKAPLSSTIAATDLQPAISPSTAIASNYKVRLATYSNPKWFDQTKVEGSEFGFVEILMNEKGNSIYMLAGFHTLQDAQKAKVLASANGFKDAYVVKDENGTLSKVQ